MNPWLEKKSREKSRSHFFGVLFRLAIFGFRISPLLLFFIFSPREAQALPTYEEVRRSYVPSDSLLLDRHGAVLHELRMDPERRRLAWTPLPNLSPALLEAVVRAEDRRFYDHSGVDLQAAGAALWRGLTSAGVRGASTISMQLATLLEKELQPRQGRKNLWQKGRQALAARKIEKSWSKNEILEAYLNLLTFRGELQGIGAASRGLFGKDPHGLDRPESLILAALIRSPGSSPAELAARAARLGESISWAVARQEIDSRVEQVLLLPQVLRPQAALAPHVARKLLKGAPPGTAQPCALDRSLQQFAWERLAHHLRPLRRQNVRDGAVLVMENRTGEVLAYVSRSGLPSLGRFVDGVQAKRQAGSTLKPFLYALAFDQRLLTPASLLNDAPLDIAVASGIYHPRNYDSRFQGLVTARVALASSLNVPAVATLSLVGNERFLRQLRRLGFQGLGESGDFYGPSLALGSADVSLWELVNAYRALANGGEWAEPHLTRGPVLPPDRRRVLSREANFLVTEILADREARSLTFGLENPLATRFWTAVKTGTSKDMRDNWCIGFSRETTVGVWVGNFSGEPMWNVSGVSGAAPVWIEIMERLHERKVSTPPEPPSGLVKKRIAFPPGLEPEREDWFVRGTEPPSPEKKIGQYNQRILYPPAGTVFALDPDIPPELQKVFFVAQIKEDGWGWILDGQTLGTTGRSLPWTPRA